MVAQTARRADDDMRAAIQRAPLLARIHAADAGHDPRPGLGVEPLQFALHLQGEFPCRRDDQRQRLRRRSQPGLVAHQRWRDGEAKADGLARSGLRRNQKVRLIERGIRDRLLHRGQRVVSTFGEGVGKGRDHGEKSVAAHPVGCKARPLRPLPQLVHAELVRATSPGQCGSARDRRQGTGTKRQAPRDRR